MKVLSKVIKKIKYIYRLIITTPRYKLIIFLQFISGVSSIVGLPMLIPVLNYLKDGAISAGEGSYSMFMERALGLFGIEPNFYIILGIASVLILTSQVLVFASTLIAANARADLSERYRRKIFNAYSRANWLWLLDNRSGEMNYSVLDEAVLAGVAHLNAQRVFIYLVQVFVLLFVAIKLSPAVTLLALAVYGLFAVFSALNSTYVLKLGGMYNQKSKKLSNDLNELQQNKKFFKTSLLNEKLIRGIFTHLRDITKITKKEHVYIEAHRTSTLTVTFLFLISLMFFHSQLSLSYSVLLVILLIFLRIAPQFASLTVAYMTLDRNIPIYQSLHNRLKDLHDNEEENGRERFNENDAIRFKEVSFVYPNGSKVFENLNVTIEPHKATAFIGSSGVGKTTLLDLILGLLKPASGNIFYGDVAHDKLDKSSLRSKIAYVGQETTLMDGTLKENLGIRSKKDFLDFTLNPKNNGILTGLGFKEIMWKMPEAFDTPIGENGVKLSGGQRQRVAFARALMANPKILILDEATSNLDSESERLIQETIRSLQKDLTIIIVTHRLPAVRFADKIYVLDEKGVCESGNYEELLEQKGKLYFFDSLQK